MKRNVVDRWDNQEEALQFALSHDACMLDMEMGTGKTRVAIDASVEREDVRNILIVCPKSVMPVWEYQIGLYCTSRYTIVSRHRHPNLKSMCDDIYGLSCSDSDKNYIVVNYESVWRNPISNILLDCGIDMIVLDESHRAKSAGSKVSKYLHLLGKRVKYKMCLSGTPMANSPLDVYGQYRFLDNTIFGTNHSKFLQEYAILGGPENRFVVGFKNQDKLIDKFNSIAYSCKMCEVADKLKLPEEIPPVVIPVHLGRRDMNTIKELNKDFVTECTNGFIVASNVLVKMLRIQQITSGFCEVVDGPNGDSSIEELNNEKQMALKDIIIDCGSRIVVFCVFRHDLDSVHSVCDSLGREYYELSGRMNELDDWKNCENGILAVQIQAGAEGVDMTDSHTAVYYSLPHSLSLYEQSKARLYRAGQKDRVLFIHIVAEGTIDEGMYNSLIRKKDVIASIKDGSFKFGYIK